MMQDNVNEVGLWRRREVLTTLLAGGAAALSLSSLEIRAQGADAAASASSGKSGRKTDMGITVLTAGAVMGVVKATVEKWNQQHPECPATMRPGGSVDLLRDVIAGKPCDVLVSADDGIIADMLMPQYVAGYHVFAGNKMVLTATEGNSISSADWEEKLLAPDAKFFHMNPYGDPGGYRAVMVMLLADQYEKGLTAKLMNHPGHIGMDRNLTRENTPPYQYMFGYYSGPASRGVPFAELPAVMDLSDEALAPIYAQAKFAVDDKNTVTGAPIAHALALPLTSRNREMGRKFSSLFLENDFAAHKFLPRTRTVGKWEL